MNGLLHLIGRFDDPHAGADRSAMELGNLLAERLAVRFWSDGAAHPWFASQGVRQIRQLTDDAPKGGTVVFSGVHVRVGEWLRQAGASRITVRYNLPNHGALFSMIEQVRDLTNLEPDIVFVSRALQAAVGLPGRVESSMIRLEPFLDIPLERGASRPFTIGRASRDVPEKHHPDDPALYRMLAAQGHQIRIMGGTCLQAALGGVPGIELLAAGAEPMPEFFSSLDLMLYRTGSFYEAYGRVIFEAMASGLPVVAAGSGGYAESVVGDHGVILIASQEQAMSAMGQLATDTALLSHMRVQARRRAIALHGDEAIRQVIETYLQ